MSWLELHLEVPAAEVERVEDALLAQGALSITATDNANEPILEPPPGTQPLWSSVRLIGLFTAAIDRDQILSQVRRQLPRSDVPAQWRQLEDRVWEREWLAHYQPIRIRDDFWVHTEAVEQPGATTLLLDPGLAFGTGTHQTTALCLAWLVETDCRGRALIDLGCGSGILAIGGLLRGASRAWCLDIDPQALTATRNNMARNGFSEDRYLLLRALEEVSEPVDLLVANILAAPLMELAPAIAASVRRDGLICLSGILVHQAADLLTAYEPYFAALEIAQRDDWVRINGQRRG